MKFLKYTLYFFVSWGCAIAFFDSSIIVTIVLTSLLLFLSNGEKISFPNSNRSKQLVYVVLMIMGSTMIVVNEMFIEYDLVTIIGAIIFSISFSSWITKQIKWDTIKAKFINNKQK